MIVFLCFCSFFITQSRFSEEFSFSFFVFAFDFFEEILFRHKNCGADILPDLIIIVVEPNFHFFKLVISQLSKICNIKNRSNKTANHMRLSNKQKNQNSVSNTQTHLNFLKEMLYLLCVSAYAHGFKKNV